MHYGVLADVVLVLHLIFIVFAALGGLLAMRWRWVPWLHLPAVAWAGLIEATGGICPLTPLENRLRLAAGRSTYEGDFVAQYLVPIIYPDKLTREVQWLLAGALVAINVAIYAMVWRRRRRVQT